MDDAVAGGAHGGDIEMPGDLSGMDLAFRLRERWPSVPVVLVTGYAKQLEEAVSGGVRVLSTPAMRIVPDVGAA
jgi:CheY-like chemotaxis protein